MTEVNSYGENNVLMTAVNVGEYLKTLEVPYCFIGGVSYLRWGEPRQTVDVDGVLFTDFGREKFFAETLTTEYQSRIDNPIEFAIQNRIVLLQTTSGIGVDLSLGGLPYEQRMIDRSSDWKIPQHGTIRTCSAEDLVVLKTFASRPQDWIDVEKVIIRQDAKLDRELIKTELQPLLNLKEEPEAMDDLAKLFTKHMPT